ncbi:MAG: carboxypeptidase regulatory-like domain-containing protein [Wenzhouxiangella sp.]|nr:MAG: carboxypeptidase regulatory-like domain-containing protein [Wenzhouxiangella sp.]
MRYHRLCGVVFVASVVLHSSALLADGPATISGTITSAEDGSPIAGATVVVSANRVTFWTTISGADGSYTVEVDTPVTLPSVYLEAGSPDHRPWRFGAVEQPECYFGCAGDGSFSLSPGDSLIDRNMSLSSGGGHFSGTVLAAGTGAPLENIQVRPFSRTANVVAQFSELFFGVTAADGTYQTPLALPPGEYHALTQSNATPLYSTRAFGNLPCQYDSCLIRNSDPVTIADATLSSNVNFNLTPAAALSGTVLPDDIVRDVWVYDAAGQQVMISRIVPGQSSWQFDQLTGGSYYLQIGPPTGLAPYVRQLHNGRVCPFAGCERANGPALSVAAGGSTDNIDIVLTRGGQLEGRLVDGATGGTPSVDDPGGTGALGLYNIFQADGTVVGGGAMWFRDGQVELVRSSAIPPGDYFVRTYASFNGDGIGSVRPGLGLNTTIPGFADGAFPAVACAGVACDLSQAQAVTFTAGEVSNIEIELSPGSDITGSVVDDATDQGLQQAIVELIDANNRRLAVTWTDADGNFSFGAFPAGTYYLRTAMSSSLGEGMGPIQLAYFDRVHGAPDPCSELLCNPTSGEAITLDGTNPAGPFKLRVSAGPVIRGRIFDQSSGTLITRGRVEVRDDQDRLVGIYKISIDEAAAYQTTALPPGTYSVIPIVSPAFVPLPTPAASPDSNPATTRSRATGGFLVTLGTESVEADLAVVDRALDAVFFDRFRSSTQGL